MTTDLDDHLAPSHFTPTTKKDPCNWILHGTNVGHMHTAHLSALTKTLPEGHQYSPKIGKSVKLLVLYISLHVRVVPTKLEI